MRSLYRGPDVACGAASHLRLKLRVLCRSNGLAIGRMWSGFSSEIETKKTSQSVSSRQRVACGAASHLRLKPGDRSIVARLADRRMWSGFSSEIETEILSTSSAGPPGSHVERLLI